MKKTKKYTDAVIDLETLSTQWNAVVLSIGVQFFNALTGEMGPKKEFIVNYADNTQGQHHLCLNTLDWWREQSEDARRVLCSVGGQNLRAALLDLRLLFILHSNAKEVKVWGNGAAFDITIMDFCYKTHLEADAPWDFRNVRDVRTIVDLGKLLGLSYKKELQFEGTPHNAADDAEHEAKYISLYYQAFNNLLSLVPGADAPGDKIKRLEALVTANNIR